MLTPDRQIDRRILLQADSLTRAGWRVTIVAMEHMTRPASTCPQVADATIRHGATGEIEPLAPHAVIRRAAVADAPATRASVLARGHRWLAGRLPVSGRLMRAMRTLTWRLALDPERYYATLCRPVAEGLRSDVVVAHDLPALPLACELAREWRARLVYDSHELYAEQEFSAWERQRWRQIEERHIKHCDTVITVNRSIASELGQRYSLRGIHVIHNADRLGDSPVNAAHLHKHLGLPEQTRLLLYQGGLCAGRNLETLVDAMTLVRNASVALVLLGDGPLLSSLRKRARNLPARVHFHPAVVQHLLPTYSAAADAGIIPYAANCLNTLYCTPNKLFEFIAAGVPILTSDLPELQRIVGGEDVGLVGDLASAGSLARMIDDMFSDATRLATWRDNLQRLRRELCWEVEAQRLLAIYEGLK